MFTAIVIVLVVLVVASGLKMAEQIPPLVDASMVLQDTTTKTASFNSATLDRGAGFDPDGLGEAVAGVVQVTAADRANSDETYSFKLQQSADDATWEDIGVAKSIDVAGTAATLGMLMCKGFLTKRYVRLVLTAAGTTPSITYKAWLRPVGMAGR